MLLAHMPHALFFALQVVKLKAFSKFENTAEALQAAASLVDSKISKGASWWMAVAARRHTAAGGWWLCSS